MATPPSIRGRIDYGLDAPGVVVTMFGLGLVCAAVAMMLRFAADSRPSAGLLALGVTFTWPAVFLLGGALVMILSSRFGKPRVARRMLDALSMTGNEVVLDVGCGRGLLLIGAADRLRTGRAVGLDLWSTRDQGGNSKAATLANLGRTSFPERMSVEDGDMRRMPFGAATFDVVVSSLAIHNIAEREGRRTAIREIVRVLKPGGRVSLMDFQKTAEYVEDFTACGMRGVKRTGRVFWVYPPVRIVTAEK